MVELRIAFVGVEMPTVARYLSQIVATGGTWSKPEMAACNGQMLPINQNQGLFALLGVTIGGDGMQMFGLPAMRGRATAGAGDSVDPGYKPRPYTVGHAAGSEAVKLDLDTMGGPVHTLWGSSKVSGQQEIPNSLWGQARVQGTASPLLLYGPPDPAPGAMVWLNETTVALAGKEGPDSHPNVQPFAVICFGICIHGKLPPR